MAPVPTEVIAYHAPVATESVSRRQGQIPPACRAGPKEPLLDHRKATARPPYDPSPSISYRHEPFASSGVLSDMSSTYPASWRAITESIRRSARYFGVPQPLLPLGRRDRPRLRERLSGSDVQRRPMCTYSFWKRTRCEWGRARPGGDSISIGGSEGPQRLRHD